MKLSFAAFALAYPAATSAFTSLNNGQVSQSRLFSTMEGPPTREAPGAGFMPEWEGREGLSPEAFMKSDMSKPDLSAMWECPLTRWDSDG
jgi:hypothetical protein